MNVTYELNVESRCPINGAPDFYSVAVHCGRVVKVEDILAAVSGLTREPVFQEDFTKALAERLRVRVRTIGRHSGVLTTVEHDAC